jgi:predicted AAA+ superfamily ATPase
MEAIIQTILEEFRATLSATQQAISRIYQFPEAENMIKVAIGMRRSGKTYFLFQTIRNLLSRKDPIDRFLYINFEDDRLLPIDHKNMGKMIDTWYTLYPENHQHLCYLFFDEIQNVADWPIVVRRMMDTKNVQIYITGSSAKLLSKEIATALRGRSLSIEIFPYNYVEYLSAQSLPLPAKPFGKKSQDQQRKYLLDFFQRGGFPGVQSLSANEHLETLQSYVDTVIFRDIVERHQIDNIALLKYLINSLLKNVSSPFSINKFYNDIKSQGYKVSKDTLYAYLDYLDDAFLIFSVPIFTESLRASQTTPKKIYAVDNGLILANTFNLSDNIGKLLENQIYLDLRRQKKKIFYYRTSEGYEVDFITQDHQGKHEMIQVVWDLEDPLTLRREERGLRQAEEELGFPGKIIDWPTYLKSLK